MKSPLTEAQKLEIYYKYCDPSIKITEIAEEFGISKGSVVGIATDLGAAHRSPERAHGKRARKSVKICPKCKKQIDIKGASFCCFCGADIRSPRELLISRISSAMSKTRFLPEDARDEMQTLLIDIKAELSKEVP